MKNLNSPNFAYSYSLYCEISMDSYKIKTKMKKRIRTHTNPLNIRQRLDDISIADQLNHYDALDLEIGFGRGRLCRNTQKIIRTDML